MYSQSMYGCYTSNSKRELPLLQHIQDKYNCKKLKHFNDKITLTTQKKECRTGISKNKRKNEENFDKITYENEIKDMFPDFGESGDIFPSMSNSDPRNTAIIRSRADNISKHCLVDPPILGKTSFLATNCQINGVATNGGAEPETTNTYTTGVNSEPRPTDFFALIQFIRGAILVNNFANGYSAVSEQE